MKTNTGKILASHFSLHQECTVISLQRVLDQGEACENASEFWYYGVFKWLVKNKEIMKMPIDLIKEKNRKDRQAMQVAIDSIISRKDLTSVNKVRIAHDLENLSDLRLHEARIQKNCIENGKVPHLNVKNRLKITKKDLKI